MENYNYGLWPKIIINVASETLTTKALYKVRLEVRSFDVHDSKCYVVRIKMNSE